MKKTKTEKCNCKFCKDSKIWKSLIERQSNDIDKKIITDLICRMMSVEEDLEWLEHKIETVYEKK